MARILFFFFLPYLLIAGEKQTICLNMIVKDEKPVILNCLKSVKPYIDYWVIVDTGSTDGTQEAIRDFMKDVPGELHERPWVNFAHNRNEAKELASSKADYLLFMDADGVLYPGASFKMPKLEAELYSIAIHLARPGSAVSSSRAAFLLKTSFPCKWEGILHETIRSEHPGRIEHLENIAIDTDEISGHRSQDPKKYSKDAETLKKGLAAEPNNARYQFYLGVSYELAGEMELSLEAFEKCAKMEGSEEAEKYRTLFQIGVLQQRLGKPAEVFLASYEKAFRYAPDRSEPLFFMAGYYIEKNDYLKAYNLLKKAVEIPFPVGLSYIERSIYTWAALYNLEICAEVLGKREESRAMLEELRECSELPAQYRAEVEKKLVRFRSPIQKPNHQKSERL